MMINLEDTLKDLRNISQVIDIMGLRRCGQQFLRTLNLVIDLNGRGHDAILETRNILRNILAFIHEEPLHHIRENHFQRIRQERLDVH